MKIKTLAEILAESEAGSASTNNAKSKKTSKPAHHSEPTKHTYKNESKKPSKTGKRATYAKKEAFLFQDDAITDIDLLVSSSSHPKTSSKSKKRQKRFHPAATFSPAPSDVPAYQPPEVQSIKQLLAEVKHNVHDSEDNDHTDSKTDNGNSVLNNQADSQTDNLPAALKAYLRTPEQRQADIDAIKAESRLRWLAFYYLSRREYGKAELKQKLLDKEQDPDKIDALLDEFAEKGYQSDYRTTLTLIRENIRKGRGRARIKQEFYHKKLAMPANIDELIDMANAESEEFSEFVDDSADNLVDGVDWLKLAVTARTKKYGNDIPTEQKDKARQLRFLQYRGFTSDICFAALNYTLETLDERF
ncbi:regulatory protein RecX [Psychrobacter sp. UBA5136]|uniref:regulatory protein RecX n=1 Tax=Psychrobacter sp. UBA5136 TaxID=1947356 RepID=UPI0025D907A8|nr:regulatory protein RecX [Psychrobacter sp. UBA5136]